MKKKTKKQKWKEDKPKKMQYDEVLEKRKLKRNKKKKKRKQIKKQGRKSWNNYG